MVFNTRAEFEQHLAREHSLKSKSTDLENFVKDSETVSTLPDRNCPFCLHAADTLEALQNHVATHLQRIALYALPRSTDLKDGSRESEGASGQANLQDSRQEDVERVAWNDDGDKTSRAEEGAAQATEAAVLLTAQSLQEANISEVPTDEMGRIADFLSRPSESEVNSPGPPQIPQTDKEDSPVDNKTSSRPRGGGGIDLLADTEDAEDIGNTFSKFLDAMPELAADVTTLITELYSVSAALRDLHVLIQSAQHGCRTSVIREDLDMVHESVSYTLKDAFDILGTFRTKGDAPTVGAYQQTWKEMCYHFQRENRGSLANRLEEYKTFIKQLGNIVKKSVQTPHKFLRCDAD
jgi:hypothetical protein